MRYAALIGIAATTLALSLGYGLAREWPTALLTVGAGAVWAVGVWRNRPRVISAGLVAFVGLSALGVSLEFNPFWMLLTTTAALVAWDLANFAGRITQANLEVDIPDLQQQHVRRLSLVAGGGLLLGAAALGLQINLTFGRAVLLGLLLAVSLSWLVRRSRRSSTG